MPVAILDMDMCFLNHSEIWKQEHAPHADSLIGKNFYDVLSEAPDDLRPIFRQCLKGTSNRNQGEKFVAANGAVQWLRWNINNWKNIGDEIGGLIITLEDITVSKRREELLLRAEQVARIGGWEVDMVTNKVFWTDVTKEIHEVPYRLRTQPRGRN